MRVLLIFICSIAFASLAPEVHAGKHKDKKSGHGGTASKSTQKAQAKSADWTKPKGGGKVYGRNNGSGQPAQWSNVNKHNEWNSANNWNNSNTVKYSKKGKNWSSVEKFTTSPDGQSYHYKSKTKVNTKQFHLSYNPNPAIQSVTFNKNYHIRGSDNWKGDRYTVFRSYRPEWHDQWWWRNHYQRVVSVSGGWYYWNAGW
jgi:hypothetical protein